MPRSMRCHSLFFVSWMACRSGCRVHYISRTVSKGDHLNCDIKVYRIFNYKFISREAMGAFVRRHVNND
ncbi:hypothetical protein ARMSODRAFT_561032 [Armillaria solidipes]|uniref:Uncharacterized protein n=1 Tax=Armillaria solidipes TaxID=1076256 RepID=A0A2H3AVL4_9AGAR|nr:hypothetical protein ARMSODRAFT_561032 [Armillaria solidipes]